MADANTSLNQFHTEPTPESLVAHLDHHYELSENNAARTCDECGDPADFYVRDADAKNGFYCEDCVP